MLNWSYFFGVACITYFISRVVLYVLRDQVRGSVGWLILAHCIAAAAIFLAIFYARGFNAGAAFPYIPMEAAWLTVDWLRTIRLPSSMKRKRQRIPTALVGQIITVLMVLGALVYGGGTFFGFAYATTSYADIPIKGTEQDALYAFGAPNQVRNGASEKFAVGDPLRNKDWRYLSPSILVQFNNARRISSILCTAPTQPNQGSCYGSLLAVGDFEGDLFGRLGNPTSVEINGGTKIAHYPEIGHDFILARYRIKAIRVYPDNSNRLGKLWRLIRYAVP